MYRHHPLYLKEYRSLDLFLVGYIAVASDVDKTHEEQAQYFAKASDETVNEFFSDVQQILSAQEFPLQLFREAANRNFKDEQEARTWLERMVSIVKEDYKKREDA